MDRVEGKENLFVGGVFGLHHTDRLRNNGITHILSVIKYSLDRGTEEVGPWPVRRLDPKNYTHMSIDIDDMEDQDILVHLPKMVRFIEKALYGDAAFDGVAGEEEKDRPGERNKVTDPDAIEAASNAKSSAVLVHCAMGRSRSATAVVAYLLWKYPARFGRSDPATSSRDAVEAAVKWVQRTRHVQPNDGFMQQLQLWWEMGCPAEKGDDAVEQHPVYQRWLYKREVEEATRIGRAPDRLRFEDEEMEQGGLPSKDTKDGVDSSLSVRCKKCRRTLTTGQFVVNHQGTDTSKASQCPHVFIEPLSWMRPVLEEGALEGRLVCPNTKCGASIGRYTWLGFKCSCREWVCPAFSLQRSKVDEVVTTSRAANGQGDPAKEAAERMAALGIRMPPGAGPGDPAGVGGRRGNL